MITLLIYVFVDNQWLAVESFSLNPIVHGGSEIALKHGRGRGEGGKFTSPPLAKIQTTKAVDLKLGTLIK